MLTCVVFGTGTWCTLIFLHSFNIYESSSHNASVFMISAHLLYFLTLSSFHILYHHFMKYHSLTKFFLWDPYKILWDTHNKYYHSCFVGIGILFNFLLSTLIISLLYLHLAPLHMLICYQLLLKILQPWPLFPSIKQLCSTPQSNINT